MHSPLLSLLKLKCTRCWFSHVALVMNQSSGDFKHCAIDYVQVFQVSFRYSGRTKHHLICHSHTIYIAPNARHLPSLQASIKLYQKSNAFPSHLLFPYLLCITFVLVFLLYLYIYVLSCMCMNVLIVSGRICLLLFLCCADSMPPIGFCSGKLQSVGQYRPALMWGLPAARQLGLPRHQLRVCPGQQRGHRWTSLTGDNPSAPPEWTWGYLHWETMKHGRKSRYCLANKRLLTFVYSSMWRLVFTTVLYTWTSSAYTGITGKCYHRKSPLIPSIS